MFGINTNGISSRTNKGNQTNIYKQMNTKIKYGKKKKNSNNDCDNDDSKNTREKKK